MGLDQGETQRPHCMFPVNIINVHTTIFSTWSENIQEDHIVPHSLFQVFLTIPVIELSLSDVGALSSTPSTNTAAHNHL